MDDITALQATTAETMAEAVHLYEPREAVQWGNQRTMSRSVTGDKNWTGENAPTGSAIDYWLDEAADDVSIAITNAITGEVVRDLEGTGMAGMNRVHWNLRGNAPQGGGRGGRGGGGGRGGRQGPQAQPGVYNVTLSVDGNEHTTTVRVLEDRWMN